MNWKLFAVVFVSIVTGLLLIPLLWWFAGAPGLEWIIAICVILVGAVVVGGPLSVAKAAMDALEAHLSKPLLIELDPREGDLDISVHRESQETVAEIEVTWGKMWKSTNTLVPVYLVIHLDKEKKTARGTWYASEPPQVPLRNRWLLHEIYDRLEEEAARSSRQEALSRTAARRGAQAHQRETMEVYDEATMPAGGEMGEAIRKTFDLLEEEAENIDSTDGAESAEERRESDAELKEKQEETQALPEAEESTVASDGGRHE